MGQTQTDLLFVYGTLRRGFAPHRFLRSLRAKYLGEGTVQGELFDLGAFPGARKTARVGAVVRGEVYRLVQPTRGFAVLDEYEGLDPSSAQSLFRRETAQVSLQNGKQAVAWVYWLKCQPKCARRIPSGDCGKKTEV